MKEVTVWKCSCGRTGTKRQVEACEKRHAKHKAENADRVKFFSKIKRFKNDLRKTATSITEIEDRVIAFSKKISPNYYIESLDINIGFIPSCSNSHGCPLNGVQNWGGDPNKPTGYPGYYGKVRFNTNTTNWGISKEGEYLRSYSGSSLLNLFMECYTGSGGSNGNGYGYSLTIWAEDWAELSKGYLEAKTQSESIKAKVDMLSIAASQETESDEIVKSISNNIADKYSEIKAIEEQIMFLNAAKSSHINNVIRPKYKEQYDEFIKDIDVDAIHSFGYTVSSFK